MDDARLEKLRSELSAVDQRLLELLATRQELSLEIGRVKSVLGRSTRDFAREKIVIDLARRRAAASGIDPSLAERVMLALIESSLSVQEQDRIARAGSGHGRRALVLGGAGKMGRWFATFLGAQGWFVEVADPAGAVGDLPRRGAWNDGPIDHDLIVVATPLHATCAVLHAIAEARPPGVVFDVGSLKTPLRSGLEALVRAGVRATSVHPMFGPDTSLLSGRHVVFVDVGVPEATGVARALFAETMAERVDVDLDTHDRLVAFVLGLSHATNLAFNLALGRAGADLPTLARISSTTFDSQLTVSARVAHENPQLYYEIQALNDYGLVSLGALRDAVVSLVAHVEQRDEQGFVTDMLNGREHAEAVRARR
jgi:chorismate mutase/prephenate dehydrogenase